MPDPRTHSTRFLLRLLRALHVYGTPAHRLEAVAVTLARRLDLEGHVFSTPTAIIASFAAPEHADTSLLRVEPGGVNLEKMARLDALIDRAMAGEIDPQQAVEEVDRIVAARERYPRWLSVVCYGLSSAAVARYFQGGWREMVVGALVGLSTGALVDLSVRRRAFGRLHEPVAALVAALIAGVCAKVLHPMSPTLAAMAGLIVLVPGLAITTSMTELGTRHLVSGTTRLAGATVQFLMLGFGLALGTGLGTRLLHVNLHGAPVALPSWSMYAALPVTAFSLMVLFRAAPEAYLPILTVGTIAFATVRLAGDALGPELGMFLAALALGSAANAYARFWQRPAAVPLVPAILLLVPGSLGLRSFTSLLERDVVVGVELAFRLVLLAVALAAGLVFSTVAVPPRRSL
jgi:uncharacterized membrane protein YjjP (DUF1212 family)